MVYYTKTLEPCHKLTDLGIQNYRMMLEEKAEEMIFSRKHPMKHTYNIIVNVLKEFIR